MYFLNANLKITRMKRSKERMAIAEIFGTMALKDDEMLVLKGGLDEMDADFASGRNCNCSGYPGHGGGGRRCNCGCQAVKKEFA